MTEQLPITKVDPDFAFIIGFQQLSMRKFTVSGAALALLSAERVMMAYRLTLGS